MKRIQRSLANLKPFSWLLLSILVVGFILASEGKLRFVGSRVVGSVGSSAAIASIANPNVAIVMKFYEAYNDRAQIGLLDEIFAPDYVGWVNGRQFSGVTQSREFILTFLDAFPDANYTIEDTIVTDDQVVMRWTCTATHQGEFLGIEATGQPIKITGITIFQLADGKIIHLWNNWDTYGLIQQLQVSS